MMVREQSKFSKAQASIQELIVTRKKLSEQFDFPETTEFGTEQRGAEANEQPQFLQQIAYQAVVTVNILELDTDRKGALVTISQSNEIDEKSSDQESLRPDWQFEVEPNSTPFVLEQSHVIITEKTVSLNFDFHQYESQ